MNIRNNIQKLPGISFVIRNTSTGEYVHKALPKMQLLEFGTRSEALAYIRRRCLNIEVYSVEVRNE